MGSLASQEAAGKPLTICRSLFQRCPLSLTLKSVTVWARARARCKRYSRSQPSSEFIRLPPLPPCSHPLSLPGVSIARPSSCLAGIAAFERIRNPDKESRCCASQTEQTVDIVIVVVVEFFFLTEAHLVCQIVAALSWISKGGSLCTVFASCLCVFAYVFSSLARARPAGGQRVSSAPR